MTSQVLSSEIAMTTKYLQKQKVYKQKYIKKNELERTV